MQEAIEILKQIRDKHLADADLIDASINILIVSRKNAGQTPSDKREVPGFTPGGDGTVGKDPGNRLPKRIQGYTFRKCTACKKQQYLHARTRICPECGQDGNLVKANVVDT